MTPPAFETILPEIEARSRRHYSRYPAERREEAVQESVCHACLHSPAIRYRETRPIRLPKPKTRRTSVH